MKRALLTILTCIAIVGYASAQNVNIPDTNFKAALVAHGTTFTGFEIGIIDQNGDGEIQVSEAQAYSMTINVELKNISDLTGIEAFTNVTKLYCNRNQLTSLNVSANTALTNLNCADNDIISLDVSSNTALTMLLCYDNYVLADLNVSNNPVLTRLRCKDNALQNLDVSNCTALRELNCSNNPLTSLNVANGNNSPNFPNFYDMNATGNPNLTCIQHDVGFDPNACIQWTKDETASWSDNCNGSGGTSGINENNISFSVAPNPTSGLVMINTEIEINSVEIYTTSGQKVASFDVKEFDISYFETGVYFVKVLSDNGSFTSRIIKN